MTWVPNIWVFFNLIPWVFSAQDSYVGSVERQHQEQWIRDTDGLVAHSV